MIQCANWLRSAMIAQLIGTLAYWHIESLLIIY